MRQTVRWFVLAAAILATGPAMAQTPAPAADAGLTVLRLTESAERIVRQDLLRASLRVELAGADPARLQADINLRMTDALARAKGASGIKIETGGYFVHEDRRGPPAQRWRGQQILTLSGKETAPLLALAGDLQQAGFVFSGLGFELAPESARAMEDELMVEALARLRARAERVAEAMDLVIVRYREIRLGQSGRPPRPPIARMAIEAQAASAAPPVAEPGETSVSVTLEADVLLGSRRP
jgi:predicted secreted protein